MTENVKTLLPTTTIGAAATYVGDVFAIPDWVKTITLENRFVHGSGGTTIKAYLQTTIDGTNWFDIAAQALATASENGIVNINAAEVTTAPLVPGDAGLTDDTQINIIGQKLRMKYVVVGTYATSTLTSVARLLA